MTFFSSGCCHASSHDDSADSSVGSPHPRPGAFDRINAGGRVASGAETDAGRATLPADPEHVSGAGRQDHRYAAGDRQLGARPHAGAPGVAQGQGEEDHQTCFKSSPILNLCSICYNYYITIGLVQWIFDLRTSALI